jgi:NAD(P)-dependent dehydrogenase (short-subunit alcohol dehydrogenase family)
MPPPGQEQDYPGTTAEMNPRPADEMRDYEGRGLLTGRRALITGGDSGIGRAVAVAFAKEGADVAIACLSEHEDEDAAHTTGLVREAGRRCIAMRGDLAAEENCTRVAQRTADELGGLDILVNNIATQAPVDDFAELTTEQWQRTFAVNIHSYFWTSRPGGWRSSGSSHRWAGRRSPMRSRRPMSFSPRRSCRATTRARYWRRSAGRRCPANGETLPG